MDLLKKDNLEKKEMKKKKKQNSSSIAIIFRYADWVDILLMLMGTIGSIGDGMSTNCLLVFASRLMNSLGYGRTQQNRANFMDEVEKVSFFSHNLCVFAIFLIFTSRTSIYYAGSCLSTVQLILCLFGISSDGGGFHG